MPNSATSYDGHELNSEATLINQRRARSTKVKQEHKCGPQRCAMLHRCAAMWTLFDSPTSRSAIEQVLQKETIVYPSCAGQPQELSDEGAAAHLCSDSLLHSALVGLALARALASGDKAPYAWHKAAVDYSVQIDGQASLPRST